MDWLHLTGPSRQQADRLEAATRGLLDAQAGIHAEADAIACSAVEARQQAERQRLELQEDASRIRGQSLRTSEVRQVVDEMIADMDRSADHRAQRRH